MLRSWLLAVVSVVGFGGAWSACSPQESGQLPHQEGQLTLNTYAQSSCSGESGVPDFSNVQVLVTAVEPHTSDLLLSSDEAKDYLQQQQKAGLRITSQRVDTLCADKDVPIRSCPAEQRRWQAVYTSITDPPLSGNEKGNACVAKGRDAKIKVKAGTGRDVTILTYKGACTEEPGDITGYARAKGVDVAAGETAEVNTILNHWGAFNCPKTPDSFAPRAFASVASLPEGQVLLAGGLTSVVPGGDAEHFQLQGAAGDLHLYDPKVGEATVAADAQFNTARAATATAYIARTRDTRSTGTGWVAFFGGTSRLDMYTGNDDAQFPVQRVADAALDSVELFDTETQTVLKWTSLNVACTTENEQNGYCCLPHEGTPCWRLSPDCADPEAPEGGKCYRMINIKSDNPNYPAYTAVMSRPRVLAQASVMSDGHVLVSGGGNWPIDADAEGYRRGEIFWLREMSRDILDCPASPKCLDRVASAKYTAAYEYGFQEQANLPVLLAVRAGHTSNFLGETADGNYQYLFWGGTPEAGRGGPSGNNSKQCYSGDSESQDPIGEVYVQSSGQDRGISGSVFAVDWKDDSSVRTYWLDQNGDAQCYSQVRKLYFHTSVPIKPAEPDPNGAVEELRFLVAGGLYYCNGGKDCRDPNHFSSYLPAGVKGPDATDLYVVQINPVSHAGAIWRLPDAMPDTNLGVGRFLHGAITSDYVLNDILWNEDTNVTLIGGFTARSGSTVGSDGAGENLVRFLRILGETPNPVSGSPMPNVQIVAPAGDAPMVGRAGATVVALPDDTLMLVGGLTSSSALAGQEAASPLEIYAPTNIDIDFGTIRNVK